MACDLTVTPDDDLQRALDGATAGQTLCLTGGTYSGPINVDRDLTLRAADGARVVIDGFGAGPVVAVHPGASVNLRDLTLTNGHAELGAGLALSGGARATLVGCVLSELEATARGGAVHVEEGELSAIRTIFRGNSAKTGGAVAVDGTGKGRFEGCFFVGNRGSRGAALSVHDGADVVIAGSSFAANKGDAADLNVRGTMSRSPRVSVRGALFAGGIASQPTSLVKVTNSAFAPDATGYVSAGGNVQGDLALDADGRPGASSVAVGVGPTDSGAALDRAPRPAGPATAGAYEPAGP